jgi:hypothetical protein
LILFPIIAGVLPTALRTMKLLKLKCIFATRDSR